MSPIIILVIVILLCSIVGGGVYWTSKEKDGQTDGVDSTGGSTAAADALAAAEALAAADALAATNTTDATDAAALATANAAAAAAAANAAAANAALASLGESCSVNTCESPLVCNEYSMKCANAPVTPPFGDSSVNYTSLSQANRDSIGSGWKQIKYIPGTSATWFPGNDQLKGYGGTEFLFTTGDFSRWLICDQSVVNGRNYFNEDRTIKKSSISAVPYTAKWYYRHWEPIDPLVSLEDHEVSVVSNTIMYGENNTTGHSASIHSTGMYVFVRGAGVDAGAGVSTCDKTACNSFMRDWLVDKNWAFDTDTINGICAGCPKRGYRGVSIYKEDGVWKNVANLSREGRFNEIKHQ
jgi:hypothetical protein